MASNATPAGYERASKRSRVLMVATLFTADGAQKIRVRDLSQSGAQVCLSTPVRQGGDAIFKRGGIFAATRVVWSAALQAGLEFYTQLTTAELQSTLNVSDGRARGPR